MIRVVYITGFGRSGSTVLNITLGQHADVIATGELGNLSRRVWHSDEYCSCGARVRSCPFWSAVVGAMDGKGEMPSACGPCRAVMNPWPSWRRPSRAGRSGPGLFRNFVS
jgi:hypothetical protein